MRKKIVCSWNLDVMLIGVHWEHLIFFSHITVRWLSNHFIHEHIPRAAKLLYKIHYNRNIHIPNSNIY